jgi:hypothetical protein
MLARNMITAKSAPVPKRIKDTKIILFLAAQMQKDLNANFAQGMLLWDIALYYVLGKLLVPDSLQTMCVVVVGAAADAEVVMLEEEAGDVGEVLHLLPDSNQLVHSLILPVLVVVAGIQTQGMGWDFLTYNR